MEYIEEFEMIKDLTNDQKELATLMSEISEKAYNAGWMSGLEYNLWAALEIIDFKYGRHTINAKEINKLKVLSAKCNGWIYFDEENDETFINVKNWTEKYFRNKNEYIEKQH